MCAVRVSEHFSCEHLRVEGSDILLVVQRRACVVEVRDIAPPAPEEYASSESLKTPVARDPVFDSYDFRKHAEKFCIIVTANKLLFFSFLFSYERGKYFFPTEERD